MATVEDFALWSDLVQDEHEAEDMLEQLHHAGPGNELYDEIRQCHCDADDPDAATRAELMSLVRLVCAASPLFAR